MGRREGPVLGSEAKSSAYEDSANEQSEPKPKKSKGGRPKGSKNTIGHRKPSDRWLWDLIERCYPRSEWEKRFKSLPAYEQFTIAARLAPKDLRVAQQSTLNYLINGIPLTPVLTGRVSPPALSAAGETEQGPRPEDYRFTDSYVQQEPGEGGDGDE